MRLKIAVVTVLALALVLLIADKVLVVGILSRDSVTGLFSDNPVKPNVIDQDRFVQAYVELATLAETMPIGTPEYEREKKRILGTLGLEPAQVEDALALYNQRPEQWRPIWERIQEELAKRGEDVGGSAGGAEGTTDSL